MAEYRSEVSAYEPLSHAHQNQLSASEFDRALSEELAANPISTSAASSPAAAPARVSKLKVNQRDINLANANFKFDKDIAGNLDFSDYDFSDFDDDDF